MERRRAWNGEAVRFYCLHDPEGMFTGRYLDKCQFLGSLQRRVVPEGSVWYHACRSGTGDGAVIVRGGATDLPPVWSAESRMLTGQTIEVWQGGDLPFGPRTRFVLEAMQCWIERREYTAPVDEMEIEAGPAWT